MKNSGHAWLVYAVSGVIINLGTIILGYESNQQASLNIFIFEENTVL